jgi:uncharacterized membrane protein
MPDFRCVVEVLAPSPRIWAAWLDVAAWPAWNPVVRSARRLDDGPFAVGSRTRILQPRLLPAVWSVTELDQASGVFTWAMHQPGVTVTATHRVLPPAEEPGARSTVTLELGYAGWLGAFMARMLGGLNRDYIHREAQGLKSYCERS